MAYIKQVVTLCFSEFCNKEARWEVFNRQNASIGKWCKYHAKEIKREQERHELDNKPFPSSSATGPPHAWRFRF